MSYERLEKKQGKAAILLKGTQQAIRAKLELTYHKHSEKGAQG